MNFQTGSLPENWGEKVVNVGGQTIDQHLHGKMTDVIQRLRKLDSRLSRVTVNICGSCPASDEANAKPIDESLVDKMNVTYRVLSSLEDEMGRLENSIGAHQPVPLKSTGIASGC